MICHANSVPDLVESHLSLTDSLMNSPAPFPRPSPDSPGHHSQSPVPTGVQGDIELELIGLANALYNLGQCVQVRGLVSSSFIAHNLFALF